MVVIHKTVFLNSNTKWILLNNEYNLHNRIKFGDCFYAELMVQSLTFMIYFQ